MKLLIVEGKRPMNVLLAEDERVVCADLSEGLIHKGHRVTVVKDGRSAVDMALVNDYDAMILDLNLGGGMNGLDVIAELTRLKRIPPVIVTTAFDPKYTEGISSVKAILQKPVTADELDQKLTECVTNGNK